MSPEGSLSQLKKVAQRTGTTAAPADSLARAIERSAVCPAQGRREARARLRPVEVDPRLPRPVGALETVDVVFHSAG
jgi:hypothetical protein